MGKIKYIDDFSRWEKGFSFYNPVRVRFSETDMFGHLNNTVPFTYFEESRILFFNELNLMADWLNPKNETIVVTADLQCDFLQQVYFGENLKVYVKAASLGNSSVDIHYLGRREDGTACFVGRGTIVQVSKKTGKGEPWSKEIRQAFTDSNQQSES